MNRTYIVLRSLVNQYNNYRLLLTAHPVNIHSHTAIALSTCFLYERKSTMTVVSCSGKTFSKGKPKNEMMK